MYGFVCVRTPLGDVFLENIQLFFLFWLDFWKKGGNKKIWANFGVLHRGVGIPRSIIGPCQGVACPHRGVAEREVWTASRTPRCSTATPR